MIPRSYVELFRKRKKSIAFTSIHQKLLAFPCKVIMVPCQLGALRISIPTTPIHLEYTMFMRSVDVVDQLRGSYSYQMRLHKEIDT